MLIRGVCKSVLGQKGLHKAEKQSGDSDVYEEVPDDPKPPISTIHRTVEKFRKRGDS